MRTYELEQENKSLERNRGYHSVVMIYGSFSSVSKWKAGQKSLPPKNMFLVSFCSFPVVLISAELVWLVLKTVTLVDSNRRETAIWLVRSKSGVSWRVSELVWGISGYVDSLIRPFRAISTHALSRVPC